MTDVSKLHVVQIPADLLKVPPTWSIAQSTDHYGRDLRDLENEIAASLGITWPVVWGEALQGTYEREEDCARVAIGMMRRLPELRLWVTCSDPEWRPSYAPLAHVDGGVAFQFVPHEANTGPPTIHSGSSATTIKSPAGRTLSLNEAVRKEVRLNPITGRQVHPRKSKPKR